MTSDARVEWIGVTGPRERWEALGFGVVAIDGVDTIALMGTSVRLVDDRSPGAIVQWGLSGVDADIEAIDGLVTVAAPTGAPLVAEHRNGALGLDHVVVLTGSLERTCGAIEQATGAPLRRVRELGEMRQGFHRVGSGGLIVEVVERAEYAHAPTAFWGFVVDVADLDATVGVLGPEMIGSARDAVQPGRRIATVRADAGIGVPLAFMST